MLFFARNLCVLLNEWRLQWLTEYLGLALVFVWGGAQWGVGGGLVSALQGFYCSISKAFILSGRLGVGLSFYGV